MIILKNMRKTTTVLDPEAGTTFKGFTLKEVANYFNLSEAKIRAMADAERQELIKEYGRAP